MIFFIVPPCTLLAKVKTAMFFGSCAKPETGIHIEWQNTLSSVEDSSLANRDLSQEKYHRPRRNSSGDFVIDTVSLKIFISKLNSGGEFFSRGWSEIKTCRFNPASHRILISRPDRRAKPPCSLFSSHSPSLFNRECNCRKNCKIDRKNLGK